MDKNFASGIPLPHLAQREVLALPGRFKIAICGRRFGKTVAAAIAAVAKCELRHDQRVWWISPIQEQSDRVEREVAYWLKDQLVLGKKASAPRDPDAVADELFPFEQWQHRISEHALNCGNGSRIEFHSAQSPDRLRGAGLDLVVIDEAADVTEYTWKVVIKPMLLEKRGEAFIVGTPRGKNNWLHQLFLLGRSAENSSYSSVQFPTRANPLIPLQDLEDYRLEMTPELYRQEFEAEFIDGADTIFAGVEDALAGEVLQRGRPGMKYITGIDLGQKVDYTALCSIACADKKMDGFARFNQMDWRVQEAKILEHLRQFPGPAIVDATGNGQRIYELLREQHRGYIHPFNFTAQSRADILVGLQLGFSHRNIRIANARTLVEELYAFTWLKERDAGVAHQARMGAPSGLHDDCVMALAMAWWGLEKGGIWGASEVANPWAAAGIFG